MRNLPLTLAALLLAALLVACGASSPAASGASASLDGSTLTDGSTAATDAGFDGGALATPDGGATANADAGTTADADAGAIAGADAGATGADAGAIVDADAGNAGGGAGAGAGTPGTGPQIAGCPVFPPESEWNRNVSADPVDAHSADYLAEMNGAQFLHPDFGGYGVYGKPYLIVSGAQPRVPMQFQYASESDPGPYPFPRDVPVQGGAASTGDRHAVVIDRDRCLLYETFDTHWKGPGFFAGSGALFDLRSAALRPDRWTSATASGLPIFAGLARYDEAVVQGEIRHALSFTAVRTQNGFIHPATHQTASSGRAWAAPMGLRVRLKASFDLSLYRGAAHVILVGLQRYGMMLIDNGTDWVVAGAQDARWPEDELEQLKTVPASAFEVVRAGEILR